MVAQGTAFDHAHRLYAAATALLDVVALATLAHAILLSYQSRITAWARADPGQATLDYRQRGLKQAVIGDDGRASTSKTQVVLWTGAVIWALTDLFLLARVYPGGNLFSPAGTSNLRPEYLVLLGLPVAAAVTAKAVVSGSNGGIGPVKASDPAASLALAQATRVYVRNPAPAGVNGITAGVAELITTDGGSVDWPKLQYVVFTLITFVYFVVQVLTEPQHGLPVVPAVLLILMGLSACGYTAAKILETKGAAIPYSGTSVRPQPRPASSPRRVAAQATPQVQRDPRSDRTGTLISLWIGVVTCVGVFVASSALAHGPVRIGGMIFSAVATAITFGCLIFTATH